MVTTLRQHAASGAERSIELMIEGTLPDTPRADTSTLATCRPPTMRSTPSACFSSGPKTRPQPTPLDLRRGGRTPWGSAGDRSVPAGPAGDRDRSTEAFSTRTSRACTARIQSGGAGSGVPRTQGSTGGGSRGEAIGWVGVTRRPPSGPFSRASGSGLPSRTCRRGSRGTTCAARSAVRAG